MGAEILLKYQFILQAMVWENEDRKTRGEMIAYRDDEIAHEGLLFAEELKGAKE